MHINEASLSWHQRDTLDRLAQGATLMIDSEDRIWIGRQRIFANTFFALRTQNLIVRSATPIVGQKVFELSEKGKELLNGIGASRATPLRWARAATMSPVIERQGATTTEHGPGNEFGSPPLQAPRLAPRSQRTDADLNWFAWVLLAALIGVVVVFLIT